MQHAFYKLCKKKLEEIPVKRNVDRCIQKQNIWNQV